jgi:two-component system response regulator HydG
LSLRGHKAPARRALEACRWPGNVRELVNAMKHGAALSRGADVEVAHLPEDVANPGAQPAVDGPLRPLADVEREHVIRVLEACGGHQVDAARVLGIGRTTLWRKLRAFGLESGE